MSHDFIVMLSAVGLIAVGLIAVGLIAIGLIAVGLIAVGLTVVASLWSEFHLTLKPPFTTGRKFNKTFLP
jgi:hypothetical protein